VVLSPPGGWASLAVATEAVIDDFVGTLPAQSRATARILRGARCLTKPALLQEWAAALQFPGYFGDNWDAFEECLADRGWLAGDVHVAVLTAADRILEDQLDERSTFLRILKTVAENPGERPLRVLFQCDDGNEAATRAMLEEEGIRI
jgi:hypothetical protein